jgi:acyl carrier protein
MDRAAVLQKLTGIFRTTFDSPDLVLEDTMTANDVAGWDSLSHINLILAVERGFNLRLTMREARGLKNVGDLIAMLEKKAA